MRTFGDHECVYDCGDDLNPILPQQRRCGICGVMAHSFDRLMREVEKKRRQGRLDAIIKGLIASGEIVVGRSDGKPWAMITPSAMDRIRHLVFL